MNELARIMHESVGDVELVRVAGEIDASNVGELRERVLDSVPNTARGLVLDLSDTRYIDSSGIGLIFESAARLRDRRQELRLVVIPRSFVAEVLASASIGDSIPIDPATATALSAAQATRRSIR